MGTDAPPERTGTRSGTEDRSPDAPTGTAAGGTGGSPGATATTAPGFGPLAVLAGLLLAARRLARGLAGRDD